MDSYPYGTLGGHSTEQLFFILKAILERYLTDLEKHSGPLRKNKNGAKPKMTDAEVLAYVLVGELKQFTSERAWHHEFSTTFAHLVPCFLSRSRLVVRRIQLAPLLENFRRKLLEYLGLDSGEHRFIDSKPVILAHYGRARTNKNKRFRPRWLRDKHSNLSVEVEPGFADIGICPTKGENYFGMKLHMMTTFGAIPTSWGLTAATISDCRMVIDLIHADPKRQRGESLCVWADNGYEYQALSLEVQELGHELYAFPKKAKAHRWPRDLRRMIRGHRQKIETKFSEGKRFLGLERPRASSAAGLLAEIGVKIMGLTLYMIAPYLPALAEGRL